MRAVSGQAIYSEKIQDVLTMTFGEEFLWIFHTQVPEVFTDCSEPTRSFMQLRETVR